MYSFQYQLFDVYISFLEILRLELLWRFNKRRGMNNEEEKEG